nr:MAG TPA_asm: hypothetical protein [Caudoviricetes sp.]
MGTFVNKATGVVFSVDDSKDERYSGDGYGQPEDSDKNAKRAPAKKAAAKPATDSE